MITEKEINPDNLVKLNGNEQIYNLSQGRLVYIEHPTKGVALVDYKNVFVNTMPLTDQQLKELDS